MQLGVQSLCSPRLAEALKDVVNGFGVQMGQICREMAVIAQLFSSDFVRGEIMVARRLEVLVQGRQAMCLASSIFGDSIAQMANRAQGPNHGQFGVQLMKMGPNFPQISGDFIWAEQVFGKTALVNFVAIGRPNLTGVVVVGKG